MCSFKQTTLLTLAAAASISCSNNSNQHILYVGTYGENVHVLSYDALSAQLQSLDSIPAHNPSYLALCGDDLYVVNEAGESSGASSFSRKDGRWELSGECRSVTDDPCYILRIDDKVYTADYTGGSLSIISTRDDAMDTLYFQRHYEGAHIHQVKEMPSAIRSRLGIEERFILISDLGNDCIRVNRLSDNFQVAEIALESGAGPRHMEWNEEKGMLYCISELSGELYVWEAGAESSRPTFTLRQRILAEEQQNGGSADIHLHPSGRFLYTSHRLCNDGISVFRLDEKGLAEKVGYRHTGSHPRNFTFSPDEKRLLVACRDSSSIEVYDIDSESGMLSECISRYKMASDKPVCLIFE